MPVNIPVLLADNKNYSTAYPALIHLEFIPALPAWETRNHSPWEHRNIN